MKIEGLKVFVQMLKRMFNKGLMTVDNARQMCDKRIITVEQFKEITGQDY